MNIHAAAAKKEMASSQRMIAGLIWAASRVPTAPARKWLLSVAVRIPRMTGSGARKRAASTSASSWVLSPISARATTPADTRNASTAALLVCVPQSPGVA